MKRIILIIFVVFSFAACKKNGASPSVNISGKWELRETTGGFRDSIYKPGNGNIYLFTGFNNYKHFTNGTQDAIGTYQVKTNSYQLGDGQYDEIIFDNNTSGDALTLNGSKLTIGTSVADGLASYYQKIAN